MTKVLIFLTLLFCLSGCLDNRFSPTLQFGEIAGPGVASEPIKPGDFEHYYAGPGIP